MLVASNQHKFIGVFTLIGRILFFAIFLALIYGVQRFWFLRAWNWISGLAGAQWRTGLQIALIAAALAMFAALFDSLLGHVVSRAPFGKGLITVSRLWVVASLFALIAVKSVGGIEWATNAVANLRHGVAINARGGSDFDASRRTLFRYAAYLAGSLPFLAATYGFAAGRLRYTVERVDVPIANLPPELDGLRIAQLSDIHIGDYMPPREIARAVEMANELSPDISFVTGDFVSSEGDPLDACINELAKLRAPLGVWGCNGNHEIYAGVEDEAERLFQQHGMRLLRARSEVIEYKGARFNLLGVDYQRDHMVSGERTTPMLTEIEHLVRSDMPNVLLSHNPNSFPRAAALGIELSLAGHTHGGQIKVEIVDHDITPARLISPFVAGLYRLPMGQLSAVSSQVPVKSHGADNLVAHPNVALNATLGWGTLGSGGAHGNSNASGCANGTSKAALYVNRGLGTFGFPVRIGVPPEITLLTLRRG